MRKCKLIVRLLLILAVLLCLPGIASATPLFQSADPTDLTDPDDPIEPTDYYDDNYDDNMDSIEELPSDDYHPSYSVEGDVFVITNTRENDKVNIHARKIWDDADNQDNKRPASVRFQLKADGINFGDPVEVTGDTNEWIYTWSALDKNRAGAIPIIYTVEELTNVPEYTRSVSDNGLTITNTHEIDKTSYTVKWEWDDDNNRDGVRPDNAKIRIINENTGEVTQEIDIPFDSRTYETVINIPTNQEGEVGIPVKYKAVTVDLTDEYEEQPGDGASDTVFSLKGVHDSEKITAKVTVKWADAGNQDGLRPDTLPITLTDDSTTNITENITGTTDEWTYTFVDLNKFHDGVISVFDADSQDLSPDYTKTVEKINDYEFVITYEHTVEKTERKVQVYWDDDGNRDKLRPDELQLQLYGDDTPVGEQKTTNEPDDAWGKLFDDLDVNKDGEPIDYSFKVVTVPNGYTATYSDDGLSVTLKHTNEKVKDITIEVEWDDEDDADGVRPDEVCYILKADGVQFGDPKCVKDGEKPTWEDLNKNNMDGDPIIYTVEPTPDHSVYYEPEIVPTADGYKIIEHHDPEKIEIPYTVIWDDEHNQDGIRPHDVKIVINDGDKPKNDKIIPGVDDVEDGTFDPLNKNRNGEPIDYELTVENVPPQYKAEIKEVNGKYEVTLKHIPDQTHLFAIVEWDDQDNADGIRPTNLEVCLHADEVNSNDCDNLPIYGSYAYDWRYLPVKRDGGVTIHYAAVPSVIPDGYELVAERSSDTVIVFRHVPAKNECRTIDKEIRVEWDDDDNRDFIRPESVLVQVYANGKPIGETYVISETYGRWTQPVNNLPTCDEDGNPIRYSVVETDINGYVQRYTVDGFTIVNKQIPNTPIPDKRLNVIKTVSNSGKECVMNDVISVTIRVQNTGTDTLNNVTVRDKLPSDGTYIGGTLAMSPMGAGDLVNRYSTSGDIVNKTDRIDANIGTIRPNEKRYITYSMRVEDPSRNNVIPAMFDLGNDTPLKETDPNPIYKSNTTRGCYVKPAPAPEPVHVDMDIEPVALPKTGFAPGKLTKLPKMDIDYTDYNTITVSIPKIGVNAKVYGVPFDEEKRGWDTTWLGDSIGWLEPSPIPGNTAAGNTALTGHVVNHYGLPSVFFYLHTLGYGDTIIIKAWGQTYTYIVTETLTVYDDYVDVLDQTEMPTLTLLTCIFYNEETDSYGGRVAVKAQLVQVD